MKAVFFLLVQQISQRWSSSEMGSLLSVVVMGVGSLRGFVDCSEAVCVRACVRACVCVCVQILIELNDH